MNARTILETQGPKALAAEFRQRAKSLAQRRKKARRKASELCKAARVKLRATCAARRERVRRAAEREAERLREDKALARGVKAQLAKERAAKRNPKRVKAGARGALRRAESDDGVTANLPAVLVPIWQKVRRRPEFSARANPQRSRTEAFLEWVEANREEVEAELSAQADSELSAVEELQAKCLQAAERIEQKLARSRTGRIRLEPWVVETLERCESEFGDRRWSPAEVKRAAIDALLAEVPF